MPNPRVRPTLLALANDLELLCHELEDPSTNDEELDRIGTAGDTAIARRCDTKALSLGDVALKLQVYQRCSLGFWPTEKVISSVALDLQRLVNG